MFSGPSGGTEPEVVGSRGPGGGAVSVGVVAVSADLSMKLLVSG